MPIHSVAVSNSLILYHSKIHVVGIFSLMLLGFRHLARSLQYIDPNIGLFLAIAFPFIFGTERHL